MQRKGYLAGPRGFGEPPRRTPYANPVRPVDRGQFKRGFTVRYGLADQVRFAASGATMIRGGRMVQPKGDA